VSSATCELDRRGVKVPGQGTRSGDLAEASMRGVGKEPVKNVRVCRCANFEVMYGTKKSLGKGSGRRAGGQQIQQRREGMVWLGRCTDGLEDRRDRWMCRHAECIFVTHWLGESATEERESFKTWAKRWQLK
jgi:hypothetical protein